MRRFLLTTLTALLLTGPAHAAAPPPQWLPQDSWPGGKQYDARLEKTVTFWATGVPAADLFAGITQQTGVPLGFSPPDDDNARLCLNVYLNPKEPPTLRDLLVQIGWVMDCAWAVEGEGEARRYVLLHTNLGDGVYEKLRQESEQEWRERDRVDEEARAELELATARKLQEVGEALSLSREEVLKRYQGTDDAMVLVLLDPSRRAAARFLLALPRTGPDHLKPDLPSSISLLSPEQQALLKEALGRGLEIRARDARRYSPGGKTRWDDWEWLQQHATLECAAVEGGYLLGIGVWEPLPGGGANGTVESVVVHLCQDPRLEHSIGTGVGIGLRRLFGEEIGDEEEQQIWEEAAQRADSERRRGLVQQQSAGLCQLSAAASARLAATRLPATLDQPYALWQLQEVVAVLTGMHVVSDHFWQPARTAKSVFDFLSLDTPPHPDAQQFLQAACTARAPRGAFLYGVPGQQPEPVRWEWGDAGNFLRFRSPDRDVWRAAFLPAEVVDTLHAWLDPYLPEDLAHQEQAAVPLDLRQSGGLLRKLEYFPRHWGGVLCYGGATDAIEQWRHSFRAEFLAATSEGQFYVMLTALDDAQWRQVHEGGLCIGLDFRLPDDPADALHAMHQVPLGANLRLLPVKTREKSELRKHRHGSDWCLLEFSGEALPMGHAERHALATEVTIRPDRLPHLAAPPSLQ